MDIRKEREAFDVWHYEQYLLENPNIDIANARYIYDYAHKNALVYQLRESHFTVWQAAKASAVPEKLKNDCMIGQTWFMQGTPVSALIQHAEKVYRAEAIAQNSKIEFGTDDNEHWFAHDVPFYGRVQIDRIEEHGLVEWDIYFNECWQGPFSSKQECIKHLEECIAEERQAMIEAAQEPGHDR